MLTGSTIFTGLIDSADVTSVITQYGYVIAGIIVVLLVLAPFFLAKGGFGFILSKVSKLVGGK
jgi:hypothetical protein